jgi:hypothetical protein
MRVPGDDEAFEINPPELVLGREVGKVHCVEIEVVIIDHPVGRILRANTVDPQTMV